MKLINLLTSQKTLHPFYQTTFPSNHFKCGIKKNDRKNFFQHFIINLQSDFTAKIPPDNKAGCQKADYPEIQGRSHLLALMIIIDGGKDDNRQC